MMIDHNSVAQWLRDYVEAWRSYDKQAIAALFTENATYRYSAFDEPLRGRDAIIADWLKNPDAPNSWSAEYKPVAVEGSTAVSNGRTVYFKADGKTVDKQFDNIFVLHFADDGRVADFCEWYMQPRG